MSLYNLVHGENPFASVLLSMLGITRDDVPRYRDCFWTGEQIVVHTRTGGGNRDDYEDGNSFLQGLPTYISDADDDYDSTYANFYFTVPETVKWVIPQIQAEGKSPAEKWHEALERIKTADVNDPQVKRVMDTMRPLFEQIVASVSERNAALHDRKP